MGLVRLADPLSLVDRIFTEETGGDVPAVLSPYWLRRRDAGGGEWGPEFGGFTAKDLLFN